MSFDTTADVTTLANGFRVVTQRIPHVQTAALGVWIGQGSRDETAAEHGVAHFLEHMLFKGTGQRSARRLAEEIEAVGGELNAATGVETTGYFARVMAADCPLAIDLVADLLLDPLIAEADIEKERAVILQEMAGDGDEPEELAYDLMQALAFPDQALGRPIIGTRDSVNALDRGALLRFLERVRCAPAMVLSAAGAVEHAAIVRQAERLFAGLPPTAVPARCNARTGHGQQAVADSFEQSHLLLGFAAPGRHDRLAAAAGVLANLIGGGTSSRLFQRIREDRGLCYAIEADLAQYDDAGLFTIYAATRTESVREVLAAITREIDGLLHEGVAETELARGRAHVRMGLTLMMESAPALAEHLAHDLLEFGRIRPAAELIDTIDAIDGSAIDAVAARIFQTAPPILVEVGSAAAGPVAQLASQLHNTA